jgi:flavodoxin
MKQGLIEENHEVDLVEAKKAEPNSLGSYDLLILGSGIYGMRIGKPITRFLRKAPKLPYQVACFQTYGNLKWYPKLFEKNLGKVLKKYGVSIGEQFCCPGENLGMSFEQQQQLWSSFPPEVEKARAEHYEKIKGRPNEADLENAKQFAKSLVK